MRDPRKTEQNQEMMDLYKKHGVNPVGGCLPMLLQLPFLFAFYKVLSVAIEMRGAHWLWVQRSFAAGNAGDPRAADSAGGHAIPACRRMTPQPGHGSGAAEDDDVHAAGVRLHVLLRVGGTGTILVDRQRGGHRSAVVAESRHACAGGSRRQAGSQEEGAGTERWPKRSIRLPRPGRASSSSWTRCSSWPAFSSTSR